MLVVVLGVVFRRLSSLPRNSDRGGIVPEKGTHPFLLLLGRQMAGLVTA